MRSKICQQFEKTLLMQKSSKVSKQTVLQARTPQQSSSFPSRGAEEGPDCKSGTCCGGASLGSKEDHSVREDVVPIQENVLWAGRRFAPVETRNLTGT